MAVTPTVRARGANARMAMGFEASAGGTVASYFLKQFSSHTLGEEQNLIEDDSLGMGREPQDPTPDVINNVGDVTVGVDVRQFGLMLKLFLGSPATTAGTDEMEGLFTHVFTSGAVALPSAAIEIGNVDLGSYSSHYGVRGNQMQIQMSRTGLLNAVCGMIAIGQRDPVNSSVAGGATEMPFQRFSQATGYIKRDGTALGSVVGASLAYTNNLEAVETIQGDGRIEDSDPGAVGMSGSLTIKHTGDELLALSRSRTPLDLEFGWVFGAYSLVFAVPRVFLPLAKQPINGPGGIQSDFNWRASKDTTSGHTLTATLINDVASY